MSAKDVEIHTPITREEIAKTFDEAAAPADLSGHTLEDWLTLAIFWVMCACVFLQFWTRYVLNDSFAWTEEIAIFCLVAVVFMGSVMCVRTQRHIHVDFLYRFVGRPVGRVAATLVDIARIFLFAYLAWLVWQYKNLIPDEQMTTVNFPKYPFFVMVCLAFALMSVRSVQVLIGNLRRGYSALEKPEAFDGSPAPVAEVR